MSWLRPLRQRLAELLSPALRRARRKRELEAVLRSAGVSRAIATRATAAYFSGRKAVDDGQ